jgi:Multicopper oxidase
VADIKTMLDFNLWCWNSRVFPGIDSLVVRKNDKVRICIGNLSMTNHPIHLHWHKPMLTGTDGGPMPKAARWPEVATDVAAGQMWQIEFVADEEGGWYQHPKGTVAYECTGSMPEPTRFQSHGGQSMPTKNMPMKEVEVQVRKPVGHNRH